MNNTIDFKTAKTIDSMSKKLDHIDEIGRASCRERV